MPTTIERPQHLQALERANERRTAQYAVRRDLAEGRITLSEALTDERGAGHHPISRLLWAMPNYGKKKVRELLAYLRIPENKPVEDLTPNQRDRILNAVEAIQKKRRSEVERNGNVHTTRLKVS